MQSLLEILRETIPKFQSLTNISSMGDEGNLFALDIQDSGALSQLLTDCMHKILGIHNYDSDPRYRALCEQSQLGHDQLFVRSNTTKPTKVELGDLGELIGCLTLGAHFNAKPEAIFSRNLAKPSGKKSETGYDIAVISLDLESDEEYDVQPGDKFTAVESKAASDENHSDLSYKAFKSLAYELQEVQELLQMYMHFSADRFNSHAAVKRLPYFLFKYKKSDQYSFYSFTTTPNTPTEQHLCTIKGHLAQVRFSSTVMCTVETGELAKTIYAFRRPRQ